MVRMAIVAAGVWLGVQTGMVPACVYDYTGAGMDGSDWQVETSGATGYWGVLYATSCGTDWQRISYIYSADGAGNQTRGAFVWTAPPGERIVHIDFGWRSNLNPDCWAQVVYQMGPTEVLSGSTPTVWRQGAMGWLSGTDAVSFAAEDNVRKIGLGFDCPKWGYVGFFEEFQNVVITTFPDRVPVEGTIVLDGFVGDNATVGVTLDFVPVDGGAAASRKTFLTAAGGFTVDDILQGTYQLTVTAPHYLKKAVSVTVWDNPTLPAPIVLEGADFNGDNTVTFEDFAILQNNYGQSGPNTISLPTPVAHVVDGTLSAGEWANWYSDPAGDNGTGSVDLVGWGAEVRGDTFYAAFALNPDGPTVAQYNDFEGGKNIWLSMWFDVDPAANPITGVSAGDSQFSPRAQDIYVELGTDEGTLEGWHSLNFWGDGNDFAKKVSVEGSFAYSDYVVEFSCPVSAILAELPNTDGAVPAEIWTVAARGAGYGFGNWDGDITDLKPLTISGVYGQVAIPGYLGDLARVGVKAEFTPTGSGTAAVRSVLLHADGSFRLDGISAGTYTVTVTSPGTLGAVLTNVNVASDPVSLGTIELANGDINGDGQVSFQDFSILQNTYGDSGASAASPLAALAGGCGGLGMALLSFLGLALCALKPWNG